MEVEVLVHVGFGHLPMDVDEEIERQQRKRAVT